MQPHAQACTNRTAQMQRSTCRTTSTPQHDGARKKLDRHAAMNVISSSADTMCRNGQLRALAFAQATVLRSSQESCLGVHSSEGHAQARRWFQPATKPSAPKLLQSLLAGLGLFFYTGQSNTPRLWRMAAQTQHRLKRLQAALPGRRRRQLDSD